MLDNPRIVVGMDASPEAMAALEWAELVAGSDGEIVAIQAYNLPMVLVPAYVPTIPIMPPEDCHRMAQERLDHLLGSRQADRRITSEVVEGRPGPVLVAAASDADLVVVGHRGDSRMSLMLGSTANYVLHHADRPVVVVHGAAPKPPRTVVVGVDDHHLDCRSSESVRALQWAYQLPGVEEIRILHAWSAAPYAWDFTGATMVHTAEFAAGAHAVIDRVAELAGPPPSGVRLRHEVVDGLPATALLHAAASADLIVVGTRGRGGFRGLVLGSTSAEVAAHAQVPVAVIGS